MTYRMLFEKVIHSHENERGYVVGEPVFFLYQLSHIVQDLGPGEKVDRKNLLKLLADRISEERAREVLALME